MKKLAKLQKRTFISLVSILIFSLSALAQKDSTKQIDNSCDYKSLIGSWVLICGHGGGGSVRSIDLEESVMKTARINSGIDSLKNYIKNGIDSVIKKSDRKIELLIFNSDNSVNFQDYKYVLNEEKCLLIIPGDKRPEYKYFLVRNGDLLGVINCTLDCVTEIYLKIK
jgi:hypothetical protein